MNNNDYENMYKKLKIAVDQSPVSIVITDTEGNIEFINDKFTHITGYSYSEVIGNNTNIFNSGYHDDKFYSHMWDIINSGNTWSGRFKNLKKNGEYYWEDASISPVFDSSEKIINYIAIKEDVTKYVDKENENYFLKEIINSNNSIDFNSQITKIFAHDFNNILNGIVNLTDLLEYSQTSLDDDGIQYIMLLKQTIKRAENVVLKMLSFNKKESLLSKIDIIELLNKYVLFISKYSQKIDLSVNLSEKKYINGNKAQILNILENIVENSVKSMNDNGVVKIELFEESLTSQKIEDSSNKYIKIKISDTGNGMSENIKDKVFEPFYTTRKNKQGLGLTVVKNFMEKHNGLIKINSKLSIGTEVDLFFPKIKEQSQSLIFKENNIKKTILLVDDEEINRTVGKDNLTNLGYNILLAKDGLDAITVYKENKNVIDFVILDMIMPNLDGFNSFISLKKLNNKIKAIICTGYLDYVNRHELLDNGILDILEKPYTLHDLEAIIKNYV